MPEEEECINCSTPVTLTRSDAKLEIVRVDNTGLLTVLESWPVCVDCDTYSRGEHGQLVKYVELALR